MTRLRARAGAAARLAGVMLAVLILSPSARAQTTGLDRLTLRGHLLGWESVGRVDIGREGFCTGTLIATDLVLTAAHCIYDRRDGAPRDPAALTFRAGYADGRSVAERQVQRMVAHPDYDAAAGLSEQSVKHDVALLQLASPIPAATAAPFQLGEPGGPGTTIRIVSYARNRANALSLQRECQVLGRGQGLVVFDCDVDFGSSGAPVFDRTDDRARIVAVVSSKAEAGTRKVGIGMELPALVADLKAALRAGRGVIESGSGTPEGGARFLRP